MDNKKSNNQSSKKVGVFTLPLHVNYGGNIQAYALMTVLRSLGHEAYLINRQKNRVGSIENLIGIIRRTISKYILRRKGIIVFVEEKKKREYPIIASYAIQFINSYLNPKTKAFHSTQELAEGIGAYHFDAIVVGSDQVWRPRYAPNIEDYFLGFLPAGSSCRRIAYAASFGTSNWEYSEQEQASCKTGLQQFDAVSVREDSAVELCRSKFDVQAQHVLDPTMLVDLDSYVSVSKDSALLNAANNDLLVYILDMDSDKRAAVSTIQDKFGYRDFYVNNKHEGSDMDVHDRIYPPIEDWLAGFRIAKYVITDSFHACVFAILFNKPFIVYANKQRGLTRFESLLTMFGLTDRMIFSSDMLSLELLERPIHWDAVNSILTERRKTSLEFLKQSLA